MSLRQSAEVGDCVNFDIKEPRYDAKAATGGASICASAPDCWPLCARLLVCRHGYLPSSDTDYCPPNVYGESKVETEKRTRAVDPAELPWVIVRPTSVWGPWFAEPYRRFFELIDKGAYIHPGTRDVVKPITFVGNTLHMMLTMLDAPREKVVGHTFYLADWPDQPMREWAQIICGAFGAPPIRTLPLPLMRSLALGGDVLKALGFKDPPLTSFRLKNMLTGAHYPWEKTAEIVGVLPYSIEDGVHETVQWIKSRSGGHD